MHIWIQVLSQRIQVHDYEWIMNSNMNCLIRNSWIPTSCRSIVVVVSALWQRRKNQQANTAKQPFIAMQLKCNLLHFQQADRSRHYRWAPPSMTASIDSDTRQSIAWCHTAGTIDDPIDGRLGGTIDDPIDGRQYKTSYRRHYRWPHLDDPIDGRRHKTINCLVSYPRPF